MVTITAVCSSPFDSVDLLNRYEDVWKYPRPFSLETKQFVYSPTVWSSIKKRDVLWKDHWGSKQYCKYPNNICRLQVKICSLSFQLMSKLQNIINKMSDFIQLLKLCFLDICAHVCAQHMYDIDIIHIHSNYICNI